MVVITLEAVGVVVVVVVVLVVDVCAPLGVVVVTTVVSEVLDTVVSDFFPEAGVLAAGLELRIRGGSGASLDCEVALAAGLGGVDLEPLAASLFSGISSSAATVGLVIDIVGAKFSETTVAFLVSSV